MSAKKAPIVSGPLLFLISVVNDRLAASPVTMVLLDDGSTVGRLTLFNYGSTIPVAVVVPVALADAYASPNRANVNADVVGQCGCSKRRNGGNYQ
jgi:hypothetical protein